MRFEETNKGPTTVLIVQRESSKAQALENIIVTEMPGIVCVKTKTVQGATQILPTIKPGQLKMIIADPSVDLEGHKQKWPPRSMYLLDELLRKGIRDSASILLLMAHLFHPDLQKEQVGLLARPMGIISTGNSTVANQQLHNTAHKLPGTVFEIHSS